MVRAAAVIEQFMRSAGTNRTAIFNSNRSSREVYNAPFALVARLNAYELDAELVGQFERDGYLVLHDFFEREEIELLRNIARADQRVVQKAYPARNSSGTETKLFVWNALTDTAYSAYSRHEAIVAPFRQFLKTDVLHFHHKIIFKQPWVSGGWDWHQDFGYYYQWYLFPDMGGCMIALDKATRSNGCLQILKGSHRAGRLDHSRSGSQDESGRAADEVRVNELKKRLELVYCELDPGSVLFFHANLLHSSADNLSDQSRWALICNYTSTANLPFHRPHRGETESFETWTPDRVRDATRRHAARLGILT